MTITQGKLNKNQASKPQIRNMKGSNEVLKERGEQQTYFGRSNRTDRGRGSGRTGRRRSGRPSGRVPPVSTNTITNPYKTSKSSSNSVSSEHTGEPKQKTIIDKNPTNEEMQQWDDMKLLHELITRLQQQLTTITDVVERNKYR